MNMFVTKDPSKGFGMGTFFEKDPDAVLTTESKKKQVGVTPTNAGMKKGGKVSSASSRADGCATKGKTRGTMITMKNGGSC
jgi:hypothetical protein